MKDHWTPPVCDDDASRSMVIAPAGPRGNGAPDVVGRRQPLAGGGWKNTCGAENWEAGSAVSKKQTDWKSGATTGARDVREQLSSCADATRSDEPSRSQK